MTIKKLGIQLLLGALLAACAGAEPPTAPVQLPDPGDLERGPVFVDEAQVVIRESYPAQLALLVTGNLPTPCHRLQSQVTGPDEDGKIEVEVFSLVNLGAVCVQVLQPFEETIELGAYTAGSFSIYLNGELVDEVSL